MATVPTQVSAMRTRQMRASLRATTSQNLVAIALVGATITLLLAHEASRHIEALISAWAIEEYLKVDATVADTGSLITVGAGTQHIFTVELSFACSVALILTPFLLIAAGLLATGRATILRSVPAVIIGAAALVAVNTARMTMIAAMTRQDDLEGFGWAHTIYGSGLVLIGLVIVEVGFVFLVTRTTGAQRRAQKGS